MKKLILCLLLTISFGLPVMPSWGGEEQLWRVFQPEESAIDGKLHLRPVLVSFEVGTYFSYAVFAEQNRINLPKDDKVIYEQVNRAYFKGLKIEMKKTGSENMEVYLDYSNCGEELRKIKSTTEKNELIEGIAAAILVTDGLQTVTLHIKGYYDGQKEVIKTLAWNKLKKRWKPNVDWYINTFKVK